MSWEVVCLLGDKKSDNVAIAAESVDAPMYTVEISVLVCEQMENTDIVPLCIPHYLGGTNRIPKRYRYLSE